MTSMANLIKMRMEALNGNAAEGCFPFAAGGDGTCRSGDALVRQDVRRCIQMVEQSPGSLLMSRLITT